VHKNSLYEGGTEGTIYGGDDYKLKSIATVDATPAADYEQAVASRSRTVGMRRSWVR
jgi:hypothetical protein